MATPTERALQGTLSAVAWEAVAAGQDTASVIRALDVVLASLTVEHIRVNKVTPESVLGQLGQELYDLVVAMLGTGHATTERATPSRRRK
jgi:hypothetical protein